MLISMAIVGVFHCVIVSLGFKQICDRKAVFGSSDQSRWLARVCSVCFSCHPCNQTFPYCCCCLQVSIQACSRVLMPLIASVRFPMHAVPYLEAWIASSDMPKRFPLVQLVGAAS